MQDEARERSQTEIEKEYLRKHKNLRKHWVFPEDFPNFEVIKAFKEPNVDDNKDALTWGEPNFTKIRKFALSELGWREPEVKKYVDIVEQRVVELKRKRKGTLQNYFNYAVPQVTELVRSRRVGQAVADLKHKRKRAQK